MHKKITSESESQHCHLLEVVICVTHGSVSPKVHKKHCEISADTYKHFQNYLIFTRARMTECGSNYGHNIVAKCGAAAWCETNVVTGLMQKGNFTNTDSLSCF